MASAPANAEDHPTPSPASDVRVVPSAAIQYALERTDLEGAQVADDLYGDDDEAELAALVAGTHPFQRHLSDAARLASMHHAAQIPAARR